MPCGGQVFTFLPYAQENRQMESMRDEWSTQRARRVKRDDVLTMHVPNRLGHSLLCLFMRLPSPVILSSQVTVSLPPPCCCSLFVKIVLFKCTHSACYSPLRLIFTHVEYLVHLGCPILDFVNCNVFPYALESRPNKLHSHPIQLLHRVLLVNTTRLNLCPCLLRI